MGGLQINAEWRQIATQKSTTSLPKVVLTVPFLLISGMCNSGHWPVTKVHTIARAFSQNWRGKL
jgi:hypothetical protein